MNTLIALRAYLVDFDDNVGLILDLRHWPILDDNFARPLEDYSFHGVASHFEDM